jgi:hypothetical protein
MQATMGPIQGFYGLGGVSKFTFNGVGKAWFVDSVNGEDSNSFGKTWSKALKTITEAVGRAAAGDTIYLKGSFDEAVKCDLAGVRFVGIGTGPNEATWTAPTVAASYCLKMAAQSIRAENIKFRPVAYTTSGVPSGVLLDTGASYSQIIGCRFQGKAGSYKAIYSPVPGTDNLLIKGNEFLFMNTATHGGAIVGVEAVGAAYSGWRILDNLFMSCITDIDIGARGFLVKGNVFPLGGIDATGSLSATITAKVIDLSGTDTGGNVVTGNMFDGEYDTDLYVPGTTGDCWVGNTAMIEATDAPYGLTVVVPAAED